MALLSFFASADAHVLQGEGVYLRAPRYADYPVWTNLREKSRDFLTPWEPVWPLDDLTKRAYLRRLRRYEKERRQETAFPFFIFRSADHMLLGGCSLSHILRGVQQSAILGYWAGEAHAGQGYVTAAVKALLPFAFDELGLHRVQAACVVGNERSIAVLRKCGFREEGIARGMLRINGSWRDHQVFAILRDDPRV